MQLVIVESPAKAKTIQGYLGKGFKVISSVGHLRDLPKSDKNSIDIDAGFKPHYETIPGKQKVINSIISEAKKADVVYLATDQDREGEAISWHIQELLHDSIKPASKIPDIKRITFNAITKETVQNAISNPRKVDQNVRKAQEARRVLDRLFGYRLSGLIWKKVRYGLSAGRVQSPALRILVEREREIKAFIPEDYFELFADFKPKSKDKFRAEYQIKPKTKKEVDTIIALAQKSDWSIAKIESKPQEKKPYPPFTTSTLQQAGSSLLGISPSQTMRAAQKLYERGWITYMRTDSYNLSADAHKQIYSSIAKDYTKETYQKRNYGKKSKNAQEAHEAIRPTKLGIKIPSGCTPKEAELYKIIRARTIASQMKSAQYERKRLIIASDQEDLKNFVVRGSRIVSKGWLAAYPWSKQDEQPLPDVAEKDELNLEKLLPEAKKTQPPSRYTEAGLVKELEKRGIGRPSTFASIISTIINRGYVTKEGRTLTPTDTGDVVSSFLEKNFSEYVSDSFTADLENQLDDIAEHTKDYVDVLSGFYTPFIKEIEAKESIPKLTNLGEADKSFKCPKCGSSMIIKLGKTGKFLSCSRYPDCDGALTLDGENLSEGKEIAKEPKTGLPIILLSGRYGSYLQLGHAEEGSKEKPHRASLPPGVTSKNLTPELALKIIQLPKVLGPHPDDGADVVVNIGRFGPYVGHHKNYRSLKKADDPYTISLERAVAILKEPKRLPKGVELYKKIGTHPVSGKEINLLRTKSGFYLPKGLKRIYLEDTTNPDTLTIEDALKLLGVKSKKKKAS